MTTSLWVNLHCHSMFSDGELSPEVLAELLAANGVRYAALTDHDTIEGQQRFHSALKKVGVDYIPGVEVTTFHNGMEIHLLGYGFKVEDTALNNALLSIRQTRSLDNVSIASSLRKRSTNHLDQDKAALHQKTTNGILDTAEGIRLIHQAGGCVFLAHPLTLGKDKGKLSLIIEELKTFGLDGIEAIYENHSPAEEEMLTSLANEQNLLICAGTDLHSKFQKIAVRIKRQDWVKLRSLIFTSKGFLEFSNNANTRSEPQFAPSKQTEPHHHFRIRAYILRIFLPTFLAIALFLSAIWVFVLPSFENTLLDRKREMIRELTNSAMSILTSYYQEEQAGTLTRDEAQALAIDRIQALRYGNEGKDYFWIQDTYPTMIMHPYRPDLNGKELLEFKDARGVRIFVEFSNLVQQEGEGYIEYVWQWKDDPDRLEPKESFVKLFAPWDWIIGTGIYIDDVNAEIAKIEQSITTTSIIVSAIIILLLLYVLQQSLQIEKGRQEVLDDLKESTAKYHAVIETMTEGTLLVLENRCRYANSTMISIIGYSEEQLPFLDLEDILPKRDENNSLWDSINQVNSQNRAPGSAVEGFLQHKNGRMVDCILLLNPIQYANQKGYILLARDIARQSTSGIQDGLAKAAMVVNSGIFRAKPTKRGVFLDLNPAGHLLLPDECRQEGVQPALADLFQDSKDYELLLKELHHNSQVQNWLLRQNSSKQEGCILSLSASLVFDEAGEVDCIAGIFADVTKEQNLIAERETLIDSLQSSLLFLHEPLSKFERSITICNMKSTILQVSRQLCDQSMSAALISSENNAIIGIVTDHDLRARVLAKSIDTNLPIYTIMTSPIEAIKESAMIYEAMMKMEEKGLQHLAVEDEFGQIVNIVDTKMLALVPKYDAALLARDLSQTENLTEMMKIGSRKYKLVKGLLENSRHIKRVTGTLSSIHDSSVERLIQLAMKDLGPPPAPFAFIAMGSQGRQESTMVTDQDNGIIYGNSADNKQYFLDLGTRVSEGLNTLGYKYCDGKVMASNINWCKPLDKWKKDFNNWVSQPEPEMLLDLSIFFDFRLVYGDAQHVSDLRNHVTLSLQDRSDFFYLFAQHTQKYKPPSRGISGMLLGLGGSETGEREVNLKDALMPIVGFARLYALKNNILHTHTLDRLKGLTDHGVLQKSTYEDLSASYELIMQMRLNNQISMIEAGADPENIINTLKLGEIQQMQLREISSQLSLLQKRISYDFLGGM